MEQEIFGLLRKCAHPGVLLYLGAVCGSTRMITASVNAAGNPNACAATDFVMSSQACELV